MIAICSRRQRDGSRLIRVGLYATPTQAFHAALTKFLCARLERAPNLLASLLRRAIGVVR